MRTLFGLLAVVLLLAVGADRLALHIAEAQVASHIQQSQHLADKPKVSIDGFPFLTQLISRHFSAASVSLTGVAPNGANSVRIEQLTAKASDLRVSHGFSRLSVGSATGVATIGYDDLSRAVGADLSYGGSTSSGQGRVKVTGKVTVIGQTLSGSVAAELELAGVNRIGFGSVQVEGISVPQPLVAALTAFAAKKLTVNGLPAGLVLQSIRAQPDGIVAVVTGRHVTLSN